MSYIGYLLFRLLILVFALLPFWLIYIVSDILYTVLFYLAPYRKKVVIHNLRNSFPEKTDKEIHFICKEYYRHLCDLILEGVKGMSMGENEIKKRHHVENIEILDNDFKNNQSIIGVTAHYGNWEWGAFSGGVQLKHNAIAFYKPLSNKYIDKYLRRRREKYHCTLASIKGTNVTFSETVNNTSVYIMAADQSPSNTKECFWIDFLNQDTACLHGPEKYARLYNLPVYYIDIQRQKRGFYKLYVSLLTGKPQDLEPGKLTEMYMKTLEARIKEKPEFWLWSHKRWKRKRG